MERLCDWVPPPQVVEHADIGPHALTTQSTGHARVLQGSDAAGFVVLLHCSSLPSEHVTSRVRVPPPHLAEHSENNPVFQNGHCWVLHFC